MIVKDKKTTIELANDLSNKMLLMLIDDNYSKSLEDDPAEMIYFACHLTAIFIHKVCKTYESYAKIYNIQDLTQESLLECIENMRDEYVNYFKENSPIDE